MTVNNVSVNKMFRQLMVSVFSLLFFGLSSALTVVAFDYFFEGMMGSMDFVEGLLKTINMAIISLATFELGLGVSKEYADHSAEGDILVVLRRAVPRFVSTVCIALALEGLLMTIKYSQLDLAGNLYYPVAIISSAAILLIALGIFIHFTNQALNMAERAQTEPSARTIDIHTRTTTHPNTAAILCPTVLDR